MNGMAMRKALANCLASRKGIPVADASPATITRNKLRAALHPDVHGDVIDVPPSADERRGATLLGYKRYRDDEDIPEPAYCPSAHGLGTPGEVRRDRAQRLDRLFLRCARIAIAVVILGLVFLVGFNVDRPRPGIEAETAYRMKAARLGAGQMACELDPHEGCLVCLHQDARGLITVASHC